jgi:uncharacterized membrane protein YphA (DoxX/SURF4 family)
VLGCSFLFCFNILAYVYVSSYGENIRVDNGCYKLVSILIGYVMNTLMNEGKMVRRREAWLLLKRSKQ